MNEGSVQYMGNCDELYNFPIRDPKRFVSGQLHEHVDSWSEITKSNSDPMSVSVQQWIEKGVDISMFLRSFKGNFKGKPYNCKYPPSRHFSNSSSCKGFEDFIRSELIERVKNGSLRLLGKVGECELPNLIMPLTIEPTKPRMCHDERFLNLWTQDNPFQLETLKDIHRFVDKGSFIISCDEKSGYDHIKLTRESETYFGLEFEGWVFTYTTLPFGWKASPFIYQSVGMQVTSYLRGHGVSNFQYIDDRLAICSLQENRSLEAKLIKDSRYVPTSMSLNLISMLTSLGYTLAIAKCQLVPSTRVRFLGFLVDSIQQAYLLPSDKKLTFIKLRDHILSLKYIDVKTLQRFAGKCISMTLVIPAAKLYIRDVNQAISYTLKNSKPAPLNESLRSEIEHWRFLDHWEGVSPWRPEQHLQVSMATDASMFRYGVALISDKGNTRCFGDYWSNGDNRPIHLKEASAVLNAIRALESKLRDHRVDIKIDNMAVLHAWNNEGSKNRELTNIIKSIFEIVWKCNIDLHLQYVPSKLNEADRPSREISYSDCMLLSKIWKKIENAYGPHTVDLMSTDANVMQDTDGNPLRHFTRYPTPASNGVNVFVQDISKEENPYVFPPFNLVLQILCLLKEQNVKECTMVIPVIQPRPVWWPMISSNVSYILLGVKGDKNVLQIPSPKGFMFDKKGLKWELRAYRVKF